jgi:hypothetical protein
VHADIFHRTSAGWSAALAPAESERKEKEKEKCERWEREK